MPRRPLGHSPAGTGRLRPTQSAGATVSRRSYWPGFVCRCGRGDSRPSTCAMRSPSDPTTPRRLSTSERSSFTSPRVADVTLKRISITTTLSRTPSSIVIAPNPLTLPAGDTRRTKGPTMGSRARWWWWALALLLAIWHFE